MLRTKRSRDQAACGLIMSVPIVLIVIVVTVIFVRRNDPNNPDSPSYVSDYVRSFSSSQSCLSSRSSHFESIQPLALPTTNLFLPLLPSADYITALGFGGESNETTTWGVVSHGACTANITALPEPYVTYVIGPISAAYILTT